MDHGMVAIPQGSPSVPSVKNAFRQNEGVFSFVKIPMRMPLRYFYLAFPEVPTTSCKARPAIHECAFGSV